MTFEIEVNGRVRTVALERDRASSSGRFRVSVDGVQTRVDVERSGEFGLSLIFVDEGFASGAVQIAPGQAPGELLAYVAGRSLVVGVNSRRTGRGAGDAAGAAQGEQKVVAPMPGRVVRLLVAPGDEVDARQPVIVVEAMKMENELRAPKAGRVKDVTVAAGASVEAGRVLVVID